MIVNVEMVITLWATIVANISTVFLIIFERTENRSENNIIALTQSNDDKSQRRSNRLNRVNKSLMSRVIY